METVFTITVLFVSALGIFFAVCLVAGTAALAGKQYPVFFRRGLWFMLLPAVIFMYGATLGRNRVELKHMKIEAGTLPETFDGYRIVQISDLHLRSFRHRKDFLSRIVDRIYALGADAIVFTGDLISYSPDELEGFMEILSRLKATDGVFSVLGNHDYCIYNRELDGPARDSAVAALAAMQKDMGWDILMNESRKVFRDRPDGGGKDSIAFIGIENTSASVRFFPSYGNLDAAMAGAGENFKILLSHDPSFWKTAAGKYPGLDLTLSGHTHAMQLSVFGFSPSCFLFEEYRGLYEEGNNKLYVNTGLGETAVMSRIGVPPEITLLELVCSE